MPDVKTIVIAVDLSEHSVEPIEAGLRAARAYQAEVLLVHVVYRLESLYGIYLGAG